MQLVLRSQALPVTVQLHDTTMQLRGIESLVNFDLFAFAPRFQTSVVPCGYEGQRVTWRLSEKATKIEVSSLVS